MTKPLSYLNDRLKVSSVSWDIQRNDEFSGVGEGRFWQAELATPLWVGTIQLATEHFHLVKQNAALIRSLHGAQEPFLLCDPQSVYPQADPTGAVLGARSVSVNSVGSDRQSLSLKGLAPNYRLTIGDKIQVTFGDRYAFLECTATVQASSGGTTPSFAVFPHVPVGVVANSAVALIKPACRVVIYPESHNPGTARRHMGWDAGFKVIQKL
ncbi:hypothetical protein [Tianweitania sediminis]|uniref:Uncharacterized protein n=1 Tax=Tianweitania sediminis TaxID=1502156 RepID=A0A8J7R072_9HYPH|nr:hypothetical protein [Tianweitania sediminis]MBP0439430.1 hypothetical protein [Tianweitania sediminis]